MPGRLALTLFLTVAWAALAMTAPADPTITPPALLPRQADAAFVGWVSANNTWVSQTCNEGLTWYQSGNYAQCCPDTVARCNAPTACVAGSQIYPFSTTTITTACTGNYNDAAYSICNTAFIYESFGDPNPKTDIICGDSSVNWSFYRKIPATATEKPSATSQSSASSSGSAASGSSNSQGHKSSSKAWIAGVVAGPIIGIALIAAVIFFLIRRKKSKKAKQTTNIPQSGGATMGPPPGVTPYSHAKPQMTQDTGSVYYNQSSPGLSNPYHQQGGYPQSPSSPAPQYSAPGSPPPQGAFAPEVKHGYHVPMTHPGASELGGTSSVAAPSVPGQSHTAELSGERTQR